MLEEAIWVECLFDNKEMMAWWFVQGDNQGHHTKYGVDKAYVFIDTATD